MDLNPLSSTKITIELTDNDIDLSEATKHSTGMFKEDVETNKFIVGIENGLLKTVTYSDGTVKKLNMTYGYYIDIGGAYVFNPAGNQRVSR